MKGINIKTDAAASPKAEGARPSRVICFPGKFLISRQEFFSLRTPLPPACGALLNPFRGASCRAADTFRRQAAALPEKDKAPAKPAKKSPKAKK